MDNTPRIIAALAAMRPDDGKRYEGTLMLSALPNAPTVEHRPRLAARLRRIGARVLATRGPAEVLRRPPKAADLSTRLGVRSSTSPVSAPKYTF
jgi:hypothetical protein